MISAHDLYVSPQGNDAWTGRLPEPNAEKTDGPFLTLVRARDAVREMKAAASLPPALTVWLRGGRHELSSPVIFLPEDSAPVTYASYAGERATLSGGVRVAGWREENRNGKTVWTADVSGLRYFRQLFVNGERRHRARLPKVNINGARNGGNETFYRMESVPGITFAAKLFDGTDAFIAAPGHIQKWKYLHDAEVVVLHYWIEERMPIASFDEDTRQVTSTRRSMFSLKDDSAGRWAKYYVDNVFEALSEPGEWFLERGVAANGKPALRLHYIPMSGETPDNVEVIAPQIDQFILVKGEPDAHRLVQFLRFKDVVFEHADWHQPAGGDDPNGQSPAGVDFAAAAQAAYHVPGVIVFEGAQHCVLEGCTIQHVGWYGVEIGDGCRGIRIAGNNLFDLGAGGIKINGADVAGAAARRSGNNHIVDNHIHKGGRVFHSGIGVLSRHAHGNVIAHNHIHDFFYSGISCGWVWGYAESVSHSNCIEKNHIHDLGHGWLSDMGGVYMLGTQPDTIVRNNLIHDVEKANYGGWGLYTDEGSSCIVLENNVVYNTNSQLFHQHYGHENVVRNNIFAFGDEAGVAISRVDARLALTFERNILITRDAPLFTGGYGNDFSSHCIISDLNVYWSTGDPSLTIGRRSQGGRSVQGMMTFDEWRALGRDAHSVVADPKLASLDPARFDWTLASDSPAWALGFRAIDLRDVGPRLKDTTSRE